MVEEVMKQLEMYSGDIPVSQEPPQAPPEPVIALTGPDVPNEQREGDTGGHPAGPTACSDGGGQSGEASHGTQPRVFFPCNREDALVLLGSLCISEYLPDQTLSLAVQPEGIALVEDGLRGSEELLLNAGRPERFPLLVEVDGCVKSRHPRTIGFGQVLGLRFRTQSEADDFRFRPVEEFDTETFGCIAEPTLFGLDGDSRFAIRSADRTPEMEIGRIADRLVAGVQSIVELGEVKTACRSTVARFLCGAPEASQDTEEIDFPLACRLLINLGEPESFSRNQRAFVSVFASMERPTARELIEGISRFLSDMADEGEAIAHREARWVAVANDAIRSKVALNGDQLSDDGSVVMRAALLGAVVSNVNALGSFLDIEKPAGPKVTATAAFLIGLKKGIIDSSWSEKKAMASFLSLALARTIKLLATKPHEILNVLEIEREETELSERLFIRVDGHQLASWTFEKLIQPDSISLAWLAEFARLGYQVAGAGSSEYSWIVCLSEVHNVEVVRCTCNGLEFPSLRFYLNESTKLKKVKELAEISNRDGLFWHLHSDLSGQKFLCCDLISLPDGNGKLLVAEKLIEALSLYTIAKKPRQARKSK